jgi:CRISPR-associated protein Cmx8
MPETVIELTYDLYSLPTAQHKAGLAGLCILRNTLERRKIGPLPGVTFPEVGIVKILLSRPAIEVLFNDLYDAAWEEVAWKKKRKDKSKQEKAWLREETKTEQNPKTGKPKTVTYYIYQDVIPKAAFLDCLQIPEPWIKLWQNAIWSTLRGRPLSRTPFNERAEGKTVNEVTKTWKSLQKFLKDPSRTEDIASSLYVGAQAVNGEKVPFVGRVDENLLLHFWPVVMRVFVPEVINNEGKAEFKGFVLAIPEVSNAEGFIDEFELMVANLKPDLRGYRPSEAVISVPQEGALEYMYSLVRAKAQLGDISYNISSVEVVQMERRGDNISILSSSRVPVNNVTLEKYEAIRRSYYHPLFKTQLIRNLLEGNEWYAGFDRLLSTCDRDWSIGVKTWFPRDVRKHFDLVNR